MSDVRKWELVTSPFGGSMCEDRYGDYVLASDYDALSARCAELERRLAGAWCVRELEWERRPRTPVQYARTPLGILGISHCQDDGRWVMNGPMSGTQFFDTEDAAKAAAQAWFNEKMTAGLRRGGEQLTLTKESLR